jgi:OOP family OmpA-OmpF porin
MSRLNGNILMLAGLILIGAVSVARAEADNHAVVRDTEDQIVHSTNGNCVRTKWLNSRDLCAPELLIQQQDKREEIKKKQEARKAASLTREERTVYFDFDRSILSPAGKERLDTLVNVLKSDQSVKDAKIVGYADRIGSVSYNQRLSQKRATTVLNYLIANGYTNARVTETRWVGKSEPSTSCPAGKARSELIACLQNDRRVEVEIELLPEAPTTGAP